MLYPEKATANINIRCNPSTKKSVEEAAKAEGRSAGNYLLWLHSRHIGNVQPPATTWQAMVPDPETQPLPSGGLLGNGAGGGAILAAQDTESCLPALLTPPAHGFKIPTYEESLINADAVSSQTILETQPSGEIALG